MDDLVLKIVVSLLGLGIATVAYLRWRNKKNLWLLLALITAILAALAAWLALVNGIFLGVVALALLLLGLWTKRGAQ